MNVREELKAYYDNELTPAQAEEVRRALETDPSALRELDEIARLSQVLRTDAVQPVPYGLEEALTALTVGRRKLSPVQERSRKLGLLLMGSASVLILCVVFFPVFAQSKSSAKQTAMMSAMKASMNGAGLESAENSVRGGFAEVAAGESFSAPASADANRRNIADKAKSAPMDMDGYAGGGARGRLDESKATLSARPAAPPQAANQLVVKTANLQIEVANANAAQARVESMVNGVRGMIESSNRVDVGGPIQMSMTLRVPVWSFESCLASIRKLGKVLTDNVSGQDVTSQVVDTNARLKVLRSEEDQYRMLMGKARTIGEVMQVRDRLSVVRQEIESLDAQQQSLRGMARMSTIALTIQEKVKPVQPVQPPSPKTWSQNAWEGASGSLKGLWENLATIGIYLLVFSPIWLPLGLAGWMVYRKRV